jgi:putative endonuclease
MKSTWHVYLVECADKTLYTGITTDLKRRIGEHNDSLKGARYTRAKRPVKLVYSEAAVSRSEASKREHELKKLPRSEKLELIQGYTVPI